MKPDLFSSSKNTSPALSLVSICLGVTWTTLPGSHISRNWWQGASSASSASSSPFSITIAVESPFWESSSATSEDLVLSVSVEPGESLIHCVAATGRTIHLQAREVQRADVLLVGNCSQTPEGNTRTLQGARNRTLCTWAADSSCTRA